MTFDLQKYAAQFRGIMLDVVKRKVEEAGEKEIGLLFSGGTDSTVLLFSFLELGIIPQLYTFHLRGYKSGDYEKSQVIAQYFGVPQKIITIEPNVEQLEKDVRYLIGYLKIDKKTVIQCMHPIMYTIPEVKEKVLFNGLNADSFYGTSKRISIDGSKSKEAFDAMRLKDIKDPTASDLFIYRYIEEHGIKNVDPYREEVWMDFFFNNGFTWQDMNKPKQKALAYYGFQDYFEKPNFNIFRRNSAFQIESGLREYHDLLLTQPHLNTGPWKIVQPIYRRIYNELIGQDGNKKTVTAFTQNKLF